MYSNCCCSCSFEPEIKKIGQSSHKMYSNNIVNCQESTTILNAFTKKSGNLLKAQLRVFANGPGDRSSILGRVTPKTLKMVLNTSLLNTQLYKVRIKGNVEQSRERSSALPYTSV